MKPPIPLPDPTDITPLRWDGERRFRLTFLRVALIVLSVALIVLTGWLVKLYLRRPTIYIIHVPAK